MNLNWQSNEVESWYLSLMFRNMESEYRIGRKSLMNFSPIQKGWNRTKSIDNAPLSRFTNGTPRKSLMNFSPIQKGWNRTRSIDNAPLSRFTNGTPRNDLY